LPPARREKYDQSGRNSKVLVKKLKEAGESHSFHPERGAPGRNEVQKP
jgi:hypothetical protein